MTDDAAPPSPAAAGARPDLLGRGAAGAPSATETAAVGSRAPPAAARVRGADEDDDMPGLVDCVIDSGYDSDGYPLRYSPPARRAGRARAVNFAGLSHGAHAAPAPSTPHASPTPLGAEAAAATLDLGEGNDIAREDTGAGVGPPGYASRPATARAAPDAAPLLSLAAPPTDAERRVLLAPVSYTRPPEGGGRRQMVIYMPAQPGAAWGVAEASATRRRRREAMCDDAAAWMPRLGMPKNVYFHAGDVRTHDAAGPVEAAARDGTHAPRPEPRASVAITVLLKDIPEGEAIATTPLALRTAGAASHGVWATVDALAAAATDSGGVARYRLAAAAAAKVDSYIQPTPDGPEFVRWGVRAERRANAATSARAPAATTLAARVAAAEAEARKFQELLEAAAADHALDPDFAEFAGELAPYVDCDAEAAIPEELRDLELPEPPADLAERPYAHIAIVQRTEPLPAPTPQEPPPDGWWPHDVRDIVEEWALNEIAAWLRGCAEWHSRGGRAHERPEAAAFGTDAIRPLARGRVWDLRDGPGQVKLFDPTTEPKRTCLDLDFAGALFEDCADRELVSMLLHGVQMKTDGLAHQIVLMPNLLSLYSEHGGVDAAAKQMADMRENGFLGIFTALPCVPLRVMPRGMVAKKGTTELRGIGDQGQPRKRLRTRRSQEEVVPLNTQSREGEWHHQNMDTLESAAHNAAVLQALSDLNGEACIELAFDFSKYFHRLFYHALLLWQMGALVPRDGGGGALDIALEYVLTMGATPSSQVAQRFSNAMIQAVYRYFNAEEQRRAADPELAHELTPAVRAALARRAQLPATCYGTQATLADLLMYCDDARFCVSGAARGIRLLRAFRRVIGPRGLRLPLSRASKQQSGCHVLWIGACLSAGVGLVWLPREKAVRAAAALDETLRGDMPVGEYRRLLGFLVSLLFMVGGDKRLLHHIFRPVRPNEEISCGPATLVFVDQLMQPVLERWRALVLGTPGAAMLSAVSPVAPLPDTARHRIRTDAALEGTPSPGLGGWLYGLYFAVPIAEVPGLELLDIPHLEFMAAALGTIVFAPVLAGAALVCLETDALATASSLTARARTPIMQAILDALLETPEYAALAPRLLISHCAGAGNPLADAASRGYDDVLAVLGEALGVTTSRRHLSSSARDFMRRALEAAVPLIGSREQPGLGATALGNHNISMDGRPIAQPGRLVDLDSPAAPPPALPRTPSPPRRHAAVGGSPSPRALRCGGSPSPRAVRYEKRRVPSSARSPAAAAASPSGAPPAAKRGRQAAARRATPRATPDGATPAALRRLPIDGAGARGAAPGRRLAEVPEGDAEPPQQEQPPRRGPGGANMVALRAARENLKQHLFDTLRADTSEHAIGADDETLRWLCEASQIGESDQAPITTQAQRASNWKHWSAYCEHLKVSPWRPDAAALDATGHRREAVIWAGALSWIFARMKPRKGKFLPPGPPHYGKAKPPQPLSSLAVLRGARAEHVARGITPPPLTLAAKRAHELMLRYVKEIGHENVVPERVIPMNHQLICAILAIPNDTPCLSKGRAWSWTTQAGRSVRTLIHVLAQTGFRKADVSLGAGAWDSTKMSFASLKWLIDGKVVLAPTEAQLMALVPGRDYAILMPGPSKADAFGMRWGNNPIWLPFDPTAAINAAFALMQWELCARVKAEDRRETPLFCGPDGVGTPLRGAALDKLIFLLLCFVLGDAALAKKYSVHSFRSYLASALLAAGCSDGQIQAALRWASAEALLIYKVIQREDYGSWITRGETQRTTGARAAALRVDGSQLPAYGPAAEGDVAPAEIMAASRFAPEQGSWLLRAEAVKLTADRAASLPSEGRHVPTTGPEDLLAGMLAEYPELARRAKHSDGIDAELIKALGVDGVVDDAE